ncbi:hypothetical protein EPI10_020221 [Gossypium australe]|uniref:Uncharacterized protein n=1 Tax=Gossypium australe TaxID=47621 RepID=A0A5B6WD80_9ROSI|nr:hypothetical protein EPI10_020221 [Gossypium australe]
MSRRRKIKVGEQVNISAYYSTIILRQIGSIHFNRALCDLGASINLMHLLIKVRSFIIPKDFIVLDFEEDREILILLRRPFLATLRSTIDLETMN